jgi:AcrR family transcriptional regulator
MAESKEQIITAAVDEFYEFGYGGARVDNIARKSGLNKAMIYYHFKSKENLYFEVLQKIFSNIELKIKPQVFSIIGIGGKLKALIDAYADVFIENPKFPKIIFTEIASGANNLKDIIREKVLPLNVLLQSLLKEGIESGELNDIDYEFAILPIIAPIIVFFLGEPVFEIILGREYDENTIKQYKDYVFNAIYYGIKSR